MKRMSQFQICYWLRSNKEEKEFCIACGLDEQYVEKGGLIPPAAMAANAASHSSEK